MRTIRTIRTFDVGFGWYHDVFLTRLNIRIGDADVRRTMGKVKYWNLAMFLCRLGVEIV